MNIDVCEVETEKINRSEKFNKKSKIKYKRRPHIGEGKRLREEIEIKKDPVKEYFCCEN